MAQWLTVVPHGPLPKDLHVPGLEWTGWRCHWKNKGQQSWEQAQGRCSKTVEDKRQGAMLSMQAPAACVSVMKSYSEKPKQLLTSGFQIKRK